MKVILLTLKRWAHSLDHYNNIIAGRIHAPTGF